MQATTQRPPVSPPPRAGSDRALAATFLWVELGSELSPFVGRNTILVFIYRGLAIFKLNAIITVDDPTSCELPRPCFEEFRGSTGEHICSLSPMWSLSLNEGFSLCVRDREQKQQSPTAGPTLGLFCARKHKEVAGMVGSKSHRASPAIPQYCEGASLEGTME
jgi:hypothetical protein